MPPNKHIIEPFRTVLNDFEKRLDSFVENDIDFWVESKQREPEQEELDFE